MPKEKKERIESVCVGCADIDNFSINSENSCSVRCPRFLENIKKVAKTSRSPCWNFQCRVPGVDKRHREICKTCILPGLYSTCLGEGPKSPLGAKRHVTRYEFPYDEKTRWYNE